MSEFYTMPITTAKTNDSYVIPTASQGSLLSSFSAGHGSEGQERTNKKKKSLADRLKISKLFGREEKV